MRIAVLSDVHSNLAALQTALDAIADTGVDAIYCLGDVVGYNADAAACVDLVRERCTGVVAGNHDWAVARNDAVDALPQDARAAARHNRDQLSADQHDYLADLPLTLVNGRCTFVHATPDVPTSWRRLTTYPEALKQFDHFDTDVCFVGHTHVPAVMGDRLGVLQVRPGHRYILNVGSVGQPRDRDPRLSFSLFDTETFQYRNVRLPYDVDATAASIRNAGLPDRLATRLADGV